MDDACSKAKYRTQIQSNLVPVLLLKAHEPSICWFRQGRLFPESVLQESSEQQHGAKVRENE